jgi:hypothetical protein
LARADIGQVSELQRLHPAYFIVNADYGRAVPDDSDWGRLNAALRGGAFGYHLVARFRNGSPWTWLPGGHPDLVGPRLDPLALSSLRNIDPTIEIYQYDAAGS